jgi:hypothetical protein
LAPPDALPFALAAAGAGEPPGAALVPVAALPAAAAAAAPAPAACGTLLLLDSGNPDTRGTPHPAPSSQLFCCTARLPYLHLTHSSDGSCGSSCCIALVAPAEAPNLGHTSHKDLAECLCRDLLKLLVRCAAD